MFSVLPPTLLALLFALPVFSQSTTSSHNDEFRALSLQVKKPPSEPICCLKPLTPTEPVDDGILLSFEEWKARQLAMSAEPVIPTTERDAVIRLPGGGSAEDREIGANGSHTQEPATTLPHDATSNNIPPTTSDIAPPDSWTTDFSYAKIPITDRYNYASLDCSASVHTSHRSAKSAHHILSSKRDRYMLSPCKTKEAQFVVVELCDDIRIDTVQLANFEFFSGVFKDFTISVAKRYPTGEDGWTLMSTYRAKNMRGVQTFHPPNFLSDFYRYIRIDFHSHYSNEFYCPVSLLRVYGLTHLEEWKWELWESESRAKQLEALKKRALPAPPVEVVPLPTPNMTEDVLKPTNVSEEASATPETISPTSPSTSEDPSLKSLTDTPPSGATAIPSPSLSTNDSHSTQNAPLSPPDPPKSSNLSQPSTSNASTPSSQTVIHIPPVTTPAPREEAAVPTSEPSIVVHTDNLTVSIAKSSTNATPTASTPTASLSTSSTTTTSILASSEKPDTTVVISPSPIASTTIILPPLVPPPPAVKGGESIYRTIINRLAEVELNQTLYMRYFEQQNFAIRDVIKRLGEDVGRLEAITRTQSVTQQRLINDWEKQRYQMEMEYSDLVSRLEVLSEEILLEKRLGVAQLCLLLAVLIFLGLTRGSRAEALIDHGSTQLNRSVREWGKRHFTISNNWTNRFRPNSLHRPAPIDTRRSTPSHSPERVALVDPGTAARPKPFPVPRSKLDDEVSVPFPSTSASQQPRTPLERIDLNTSSPSQDYFSRPRTRTTSGPRSHAGTPSLRTPGGRRAAAQHHNIFQRAATATTARATGGGLQRSNSHGMYASASSTTGAQIPPSGSWHGSGNPAKSAKKWARSAHLHQVKSFDRPSPAARRSTTASVMNPVALGGEGKGKSRERGEEDSRTPRMMEFEGDNENFFSSPPVKASTSIPKSLGGDAAPFPVSESTEIASSILMRPDSSPPVDDADAWVDTDSIDESEVEHHSSVSEPVIPVISSRA